MKKKLLLGLLCSITLVSACGTNNERPHSQHQNSTAPDNSEFVGVDDPDLYIGDLGVEHQIYGHRLRAQANNQVIGPYGFPLIKQYPKKSIRPIKGNYAENVIKKARSFIGRPYVYGSKRNDSSSFDCSDYIRWVHLYALGMDLPWDSRGQAAYVKAYSKKVYTSLKYAKRGDILFFTTYRGERASNYRNLKRSEEPISHVAIYLGNRKVIHCASKESGGVQIMNITWRQLHNRFLFGGSILPAAR